MNLIFFVKKPLYFFAKQNMIIISFMIKTYLKYAKINRLSDCFSL